MRMGGECEQTNFNQRLRGIYLFRRNPLLAETWPDEKSRTAGRHK